MRFINSGQLSCVLPSDVLWSSNWHSSSSLFEILRSSSRGTYESYLVLCNKAMHTLALCDKAMHTLALCDKAMHTLAFCDKAMHQVRQRNNATKLSLERISFSSRCNKEFSVEYKKLWHLDQLSLTCASYFYPRNVRQIIRLAIQKIHDEIVWVLSSNILIR